jgi:hypothetical protein
MRWYVGEVPFGDRTLKVGEHETACKELITGVRVGSEKIER